MAFETLHRPLFSEHGSVHFANNQTPLKSNNYAFCQDINMTRNYTKIPSVLITATHDTSVGQINPKYNGISAWIEDVTMDTFRVCLKELYSDLYDPVTVQYVVVSDICGDDWVYFNGFCYKTNTSCLSWQAAQSRCVADNANLTSITSQEENTYVQHRHGGETGWIGLQDMDSEGNFTWIDGSVVNFTYWADNQPNSYPGDQDCVHTLGLRHDYHWNDVTCASCHAYTCKRDINECSSGFCHADAQCTNSYGSYTCQCNHGYLGGGFTCSDILQNRAQYDQLSEWLATVPGKPTRWDTCYHSKYDGWAASTFHTKCDGVGPTITIIKVNQYIFGGYTDASWDSRNDYIYSANSFIFSFVNRDNLKPFKTNVYHNQWAIYANFAYLPTFGGGHDICLSDYAGNNMNSYTNFGHSYNVPQGSSQAGDLLAGSYNFQPDEVEVFKQVSG